MFKNIPIAVQWVVGVISAISLVGGIAWGMAVWVTNVNTKAANTDSLGVAMTGVQKILEGYGKSQDSLKNVVIDYAKSQDAWAASYVMYVKDNVKFTKDFTKYMEGLSFVLIQPEPSYDKSIEPPTPRIKIQKIK